MVVPLVLNAVPLVAVLGGLVVAAVLGIAVGPDRGEADHDSYSYTHQERPRPRRHKPHNKKWNRNQCDSFRESDFYDNNLF